MPKIGKTGKKIRKNIDRERGRNEEEMIEKPLKKGEKDKKKS